MATQWPPLVCPACRKGPESWCLDSALVCSNAACGLRHSFVEPGIPFVIAPVAKGYAEAFNVAGPLPAPGELASWLSNLQPGSGPFNAVSRAAIFLKALAESRRESFYRDLCDALLSATDHYGAVLDLGCGMGNLSIELAERATGRVVGLDMDADLLRWAVRAASGAPFEGPVRVSAASFAAQSMQVPSNPARADLRFVCGNLLDPPFDPGTFDLVTLVNVLDSVSFPAIALSQAVALLKPGGHLLFASPDSWNAGTTPVQRWLATNDADWDRVFAKAGLETLRRIDDVEWRLRDSPRLHHLYRVHGRLLQRQPRTSIGSEESLAPGAYSGRA